MVGGVVVQFYEDEGEREDRAAAAGEKEGA
jgi:hypothetical protein